MRRPLLVLSMTAAAAVASSFLGACTSEEFDGAASAEQGVASGVHVLTSRNDLNRTGANLKEKILKTSNVKAGTFGRVFSRRVDGQIYAQPLYVGGVGGRNVVYVATQHNSVFAFDADDTRPDAPPLWARNFGPSVPAQDTQCGLLTPEVGITATPVIDEAAGTMWFTARTKENGRYVHRLHAVDIATGQPRPNSGTVITAEARGTGSESVGGVIRFNPLRQHSRPGLTKVGGKIYLAFASLCDISPYHGWVLAYDAATLQQTAAHITTPNGGEGGIWQGGVGLAADERGDIYYSAGDVYDRSGQPEFNGRDNLGNSIVRLRDTGSALVVQTSFTPFDTREWSPRDLSIGNMGGILLPGTNLYVTGDKRGVMFLVNRDDMGRQADQDAQIVQKFRGTQRGMWGTATYYPKGAGGTYYIWGNGDALRAYTFDGQKFVLPAAANPTTVVGYPGGQTSLSADGETAGTAILWGVRGKRESPGLASSGGPGVLEAFDAEDINTRLWTSDDEPGHALGSIAKFAPPTIANGRVFVGTASNELVVYGLLNGKGPDKNADAGAPEPTDDAGAPDSGGGGPAPTWTQIYAQVFGPGTPGHCSGTGGCHTNLRGGFKCGTTKDECYAGLVAAGLGNGASSPIADPARSPLVWFGGSMPLDDPSPNPEAAALVQAWVAAGAKDD